MKKILYHVNTYLIVLFGIMVFKTVDVSAANPSIISLYPNKTYTDYDITGDGKKDKILIKASRNSYEYTSARIIINKKILYKYNYSSNYIISRIYTLKNGKSFLYANFEGDSGGGMERLFQYNLGKLKTIINFETYLSQYGSNLYLRNIKVNGNKMNIEFGFTSYTIGLNSFRYNYIYKNGTLQRDNNIGTISGISCLIKDSDYSSGLIITRNLVVNKKINTYKGVKAKKVAFSLKRGDKVMIDKIYYNRSYGLLIRLKYKGKFGWLRCFDHWVSSNDNIFTRLIFVS